MGVSLGCRLDLSHRIAEFNISLARHAATDVVILPDPVYSAKPQRLKNKRKPTCA
jgi:hypothetical protein